MSYLQQSSAGLITSECHWSIYMIGRWWRKQATVQSCSTIYQ